MAIQIQLRQGTTTEHNSFTGAVGEVTVDTTNYTLRVHDGTTVGGKVIGGARLVTTPINADTENTTGVRIINVLGNTNLPLNVYGALNVYSNENFAIGALRVYQTFQPDIFNDLFFRKWDGASWSAWDRSVKSSEKNTEAFGVGQTQQWLTSARFANTTYTNSTGRPIEVRIVVNGSVSSTGNTVQVGGVDIYVFNVHTNMTAPFCFTVQAGQTYRINVATTINSWSELR